MQKKRKSTLCFVIFMIVSYGRIQEISAHDTSLIQNKSYHQIQIGDKAPDFILRNQDQLKISLSDFIGDKNVILVFYPLDFTPIWSGEFSEYRDNYNRLRELDTEVLGISVDSFASHKKFQHELKLPFDLLSDWDREVSKQFGVFNFKEKVANRVSFLIDKKGIIRFIQKATLTTPRNFNIMLKKVKEIKN